jgi:hypothetical protein
MFQPSKYLSTCQNSTQSMVPIGQEKWNYIKEVITQKL